MNDALRNPDSLAADDPSFEEWVHYCFTLGTSDFNGLPFDGTDSRAARELRFLASLDRSLLASFLMRLFESPESIADRYSDDQIADAVWFIFGIGSEYLKTIRCDAVPLDIQARCLRSIATFYTKLLDQVCGRRGIEPDINLLDDSALDRAVYMMWDMDCIEGAVMFPESYPHLVEAGLEVLSTVLTRCKTSACRMSALHGIGHVFWFYNYHGHRELADRLQALIDNFLSKENPPQWVRDYASAARAGNVL